MSGFNDFLGIELLGQTDEGYALQLQVQDKHLHDAGLVHGGVYLSLLDTVMSRALRDNFNNNIYAPTLGINVNFFRPTSSGTIKAIANIVNQSRSVCILEGRLYDDNGRLLAQGTATMFLGASAKLVDGGVLATPAN